MRLGSKLRAQAGVVGETQWNVLEIDWRLFAKDPTDIRLDFARG